MNACLNRIQVTKQIFNSIYYSNIIILYLFIKIFIYFIYLLQYFFIKIFLYQSSIKFIHYTFNIFQKISLLLRLRRDIIAHFGTDFANSEFTDPLKAVTRSGIVNVCKGSTMPKRGLKALFPIPVLAFNAS